MMHLVHTAHLQFLGLIFGFLAWILIMTTTGLNEWRLWQVDNVEVITSGTAWVGIWRACFYSHNLSMTENCWSISIGDSFAPTEIVAAQVMMMLAVVVGLAANVCAAYAMRMAYFSVKDRRNIRLVFLLAGGLYVLTSVLCMVPLLWNTNSIVNNHPIDFPPEFYLPSTPVAQHIGSGIGVGLFASTVIFLSGLFFLCYRYAWRSLSSEAYRDARNPLQGQGTLASRGSRGRENPSFQRDES